ncbi:unnamed protein product [Pylaiella littoralis]
MRVSLLVSGLLAASSVRTASSSALVDASKFTTVTVDAPLYDTMTGDDNGCDPMGCQGSLTRDGDEITPGSRWSCKPALDEAGSSCSIMYSLAAPMQVFGLNIAMYKGDERTRDMDIYIDGIKTESWTSSGTTADFENVKLGFYSSNHPGVAVAATIEIRGVLQDNEWLSIMEVHIEVEDDETVDKGVVEAGTVGTVIAAAALFDPDDSAANGCDPAGCTASFTRDGDLSPSSRWSCSPTLGGACTISYDLGVVREVSTLDLAMYKGSTRERTVEVYVDAEFVTTWTSSGTTDDFESIDLSGTPGKVIQVTGVLGQSEWLSIVEAQIMVVPDDPTSTPPPLTTTPPSPTPVVTPSPTISVSQPVAPTPGGVLQPVGLLPLARGDGSDLDAYYIKDGDFSTSWSCTGDQRDSGDESVVFDCQIVIDLFYFRHIKEVHIAMPDGAERAVDFRITGRSGTYSEAEYLTSSGKVDGYVTSSGTTDGLEVYGFDYFTDTVVISGVFTSSFQTISISEVEFVEEVFPDEIPVAGFNAPSDMGDGAWNTVDAFQWTSNSAEVVGEKLHFSLSHYAIVSAIELQFPIGDTYQFEIELYNDKQDHPFEDWIETITELESDADDAGWQSFSLPISEYITAFKIVMYGTGSGEPGFNLLDARVIGTVVDNPVGVYYVGSTRVEDWTGDTYPDFVTEGTGDQKAIMAAICAVKKASFDGCDCGDGGDAAATGTVMVPMGDYFVDGNIFMKSGVYLRGWFSSDDSPGITEIFLEEGAAGNTDVDAFLVMDNIEDAFVRDMWLRGLYDHETGAGIDAVAGLGTTGVSIANSKNVSCFGFEVKFFDGDAIVVSGSDTVNIDAYDYDYDFGPLDISQNRGTGIVVDTSDNIYVRRHDVEENGVAGIHLSNVNNFTFVGPRGSDSQWVGQGFIGSDDGPQPLDVLIESSRIVTFNDVLFQSVNDPVVSISADSSNVSFNSCGYDTPAGTCVIEADNLSVVTVTTTDTPQLTVDEGTNCYVKV